MKEKLAERALLARTALRATSAKTKQAPVMVLESSIAALGRQVVLGALAEADMKGVEVVSFRDSRRKKNRRMN